MSDLLGNLGARDPDGRNAKQRFKDMGDGTYAPVVYNAGAAGGGGGSTTVNVKQVVTAQYIATAADTGFSQGDVIERAAVVDTSTTPLTVTSTSWINLSTGNVITNPNLSVLNLIDDVVTIAGTTQVAGTVNANVQGTVPVSGTVTANISGTVPVSGTVGISGTVPVSGSVNVAGSSALPSGNGSDLSVITRPNSPFRFKTDFNSAIAGQLNPLYWNRIRAGTGYTVSQSGGNAVIAAGTTANDEMIYRSLSSFSNAVALKWHTTLSQRIANNNFYIELVDVVGDNLAITINSATSVTVTVPSGVLPDGTAISSVMVGMNMNIGGLAGFTGATTIPGRYVVASVSGNAITFTVSGWALGSVNTGTCSLFGWNYYQVLYNGTTATSMSFDAQRRGYASGATATTINTTASPGHLGYLTSEDDSVVVLDGLAASSTSAQTTVRGFRSQNIPGYDIPVYLQIRSVNGSTAPASSTTWTLNFVAVDSYTPQTVGVSTFKPQGYQSPIPIVSLQSLATTTNVTQIAGSTPITATPNGATNKTIGVNITTAVSNVDQSATAFAGAGSVVGTAVASANGGGGVLSAEINVSALTLGTATAVFAILQESKGGTNWTDIWSSPPITATGIYPMPPVPVAGRRRWRFFNAGGTSTTVTATITAMELPSGTYSVIREGFDFYAATNPLATVFNNVATASTFVLTSAGTTTAPVLIEGTKQISAYVTVSGGVPTTVPVLTIQTSLDGVNWFATGGQVTLSAAGTFSATVNATARFARLAVSTASAGGTAYTLGRVGIMAVS